MKKNTFFIRFLLLIFIVIFNYSFVIQGSNDYLFWNSNKKLTWKDFLGQLPEKKSHTALTTSGISCDFKFLNGNKLLEIRIKSYMDKSKSYCWNEGLSQNLLNHENLHFDITELFSRKLRKTFSIKKFTQDNFNSEYDIYYEKISTERRAYQTLYDKETDHSKIIKKQKEWEKKVAKELKELEMYSDTLVKVKLY